MVSTPMRTSKVTILKDYNYWRISLRYRHAKGAKNSEKLTSVVLKTKNDAIFEAEFMRVVLEGFGKHAWRKYRDPCAPGRQELKASYKYKISKENIRQWDSLQQKHRSNSEVVTIENINSLSDSQLGKSLKQRYGWSSKDWCSNKLHFRERRYPVFWRREYEEWKHLDEIRAQFSQHKIDLRGNLLR